MNQKFRSIIFWILSIIPYLDLLTAESEEGRSSCPKQSFRNTIISQHKSCEKKEREKWHRWWDAPDQDPDQELTNSLRSCCKAERSWQSYGKIQRRSLQGKSGKSLLNLLTDPGNIQLSNLAWKPVHRYWWSYHYCLTNKQTYIQILIAKIKIISQYKIA